MVDFFHEAANSDAAILDEAWNLDAAILDEEGKLDEAVGLETASCADEKRSAQTKSKAASTTGRADSKGRSSLAHVIG